jgi:hypothetical protein
MPTDVLALVSKVIDRAVEKSGYAGSSPLAGVEHAHGSEALIDMLASQLLTFLGMGGSPGGSAGRPSAADLERLCAEQAARNRGLALALGACECWGELGSCEICRGRGVSGWRPPDAASFDLLVRPVLRKMKQHRLRQQQTAGMVR